MKCGIAIYASDLIKALPDHEHVRFALHYGDNKSPDAHDHCNVRDFRSVAAFAKRINESDLDVLCLQHEFGIWGGANGDHLFDFLEVLKAPMVTTLHTTFPRGRRPALQFLGLRTLVDVSRVVFVLTDQSRRTLCAALGLSQRRINVVPHGVADAKYVPFPNLVDDCWRFCSLGFFRPDKGLEKILEALARLKRNGLRFHYVIAGEPQPQFRRQRSYHNKVTGLVKQFGLARQVQIIPEFLSRAEQISLIQRSHAGIFAYQDPDHASSGAIPLVLATGRPTICTPFEFATAKAEKGSGVVLANGFTMTSMEAAIAKFTLMAGDLPRICDQLYCRTRAWTWQNVGAVYEEAVIRSAKLGSMLRR